MAWLAYLLLAALLTTAQSWILTSSHSNVLLGLSEGVTLQCLHDNNNAVQLSPLSRIRLLKLVDQNWQMYAEILHPDTSHPVFSNPNQPGVSASGQLGEPSATHLEVTWSTASDDTVGSYKCEVDGFTTLVGANHERFTRVTNITNNAVGVQDLLNIIVQMRRKSSDISQELESMDRRHASKRQELKDNVLHEVQSAIEDNFFESRYWPSSLYVLLTDANGCPSTPFSTFRRVFATVQTKPSQKPEHVFPPGFNSTEYSSIGSRNVLRFEFCYSNRVDPSREWPKGSYCIHRYGSKCPTGFQYGYTRLYLESLVNMEVVVESGIGPFAAHPTTKYIDFYYFCRSDGDASTPIYLPTSKTFYLYRYGDQCQSVFNMDVTVQQIIIDTDSTKTGSFSNAFHADGTVNGIIWVCRYTRKNPSTHGTGP